MKSLPRFARFLVAALALTVSASVFAKDKGEGAEKKSERALTLEQCPAPVQSALRAYGGKIEEVELESEAGQPAYDAKITLADGRRMKLLVAADGRVMESKEKKAKK